MTVYIADESPSEPDFQYIPDTHHIIAILPPGGDPLMGSMTLLRESLDSGAVLAQFEVRRSFISRHALLRNFIAHTEDAFRLIT